MISTWSEATITGILDQHFREELMSMDSELNMLSYAGISTVKLFGTSLKFPFMRCFKCAYIADYEKVKKKADILDDGDSIMLTFRAGKDNSVLNS